MRFSAAHSRAIAALVGGALALLAACGPLPRPFQPEVKPGPKAVPGAEAPAAIAVRPVAGTTATIGEALAAAMADRLKESSLPALMESERPEEVRPLYTIEGRLKAGPRSGGKQTFLLLWELTNAKGTVVGRHLQHEWLDADRPAAQFAAMRDTIRARTGPYFVRAVNGEAPDPEARPGGGGGETRLAIGPIEGAPGDGEGALIRALDAVLTRLDVPVVANPEPGTLRLTAIVEVLDAGGGIEVVEIRWRMADGSGAEVGEIAQKSEVPAGSLAPRWGAVAYAVAGGAAEGIVALIDRMRLERAGTGP